MQVQELYTGIKPYMEQLEEYLKNILKSETEVVDNIAKYLMDSSGKRLRPALFLITANKDEVASKDDDQHILVAAALELIHTATLVHDDIVDRSKLRRGNPTINKKWGNQVAVLMGDFLFAKAFSLLTSFGNHDLISLMSNLIEEMSEGEIQQLTDLHNPHVTEEEYLDRVRKKTALFIASCCKSGGVARNASMVELEALFNYGHCIGMSFQIMDDMLDFYGTENETGKPVGNDLSQGVITLPVIKMLNKTTNSKRYANLIKGKDLSPAVLAEMKEEMKSTNSFAYAKDLAANYAKDAISYANSIEDLNLRNILTNIAEILVSRKR